MDTWNLFTGSDLVLAIIGMVGLLSVVVVMKTAFSYNFTLETKIKSERVGNLTPEDNVMD